jgi:hypothetical protein
VISLVLEREMRVLERAEGAARGSRAARGPARRRRAAWAQDPAAALDAVRSASPPPMTRADACLGAYAQPCMAEAGGRLDLGMVACTAAETEAWDRCSTRPTPSS